MDKIENKIISDVRKHGWHCLMVFGDETAPAFTFSIGLYRNFQHPEIIIVGIDGETAAKMINIMGEEIRSGVRYLPKQECQDILVGYQCDVEEVDKGHYDTYFGSAIWFYKGHHFPALQCVWPDRNQLYPWNKDFDEKLAWIQPVLISNERAQELSGLEGS